MILLVVVRSLDDARLLEDRVQLLAQDRDLLGVLRVRLRREQAEEAVLAGHAAFGVELLHADVVHAHAAMHARAGVRLGRDQQRSADDAVAQPGRQLVHQDGLRVRRFLAGQDAEPRVGGGDERAALRRVQQVVRAVAEKDEAAVAQPAQERLDLLDLVGALRDLARVVREPGDGVVQCGEQILERAGRLDHVGEVAGDQVAQLGTVGLLADPPDFAVDERLLGIAERRRAELDDAAVCVPRDVENGVDEALDRELAVVQQLADRVHDERPLRHVRAYDGDRRVPAIPLGVRIHDLDVNVGVPLRVHEAEAVQGDRGELVEVALVEEFARRLREHHAREREGQLLLARLREGRDPGARLLDQWSDAEGGVHAPAGRARAVGRCGRRIRLELISHVRVVA